MRIKGFKWEHPKRKEDSPELRETPLYFVHWDDDDHFSGTAYIKKVPKVDFQIERGFRGKKQAVMRITAGDVVFFDPNLRKQIDHGGQNE